MSDIAEATADVDIYYIPSLYSASDEGRTPFLNSVTRSLVKIPSETHAAITSSNRVLSTFITQSLLFIKSAVSLIICVSLRRKAHISVSVKRFRKVEEGKVGNPPSEYL
tara:strand:- start:129 stop:455 length:327 start_codon:yes stop_codon:yes gene_type:complete